MSENSSELTPWAELDDKTRLQLRQDYQAELDANPRTCSLDEKMARFTEWLAGRGVSFTMDDLRRR